MRGLWCQLEALNTIFVVQLLDLLISSFNKIFIFYIHIPPLNSPTFPTTLLYGTSVKHPGQATGFKSHTSADKRELPDCHSEGIHPWLCLAKFQIFLALIIDHKTHQSLPLDFTKYRIFKNRLLKPDIQNSLHLQL